MFSFRKKKVTDDERSKLDEINSIFEGNPNDENLQAIKEKYGEGIRNKKHLEKLYKEVTGTSLSGGTSSGKNRNSKSESDHTMSEGQSGTDQETEQAEHHQAESVDTGTNDPQEESESEGDPVLTDFKEREHSVQGAETDEDETPTFEIPQGGPVGDEDPFDENGGDQDGGEENGTEGSEGSPPIEEGHDQRPNAEKAVDALLKVYEKANHGAAKWLKISPKKLQEMESRGEIDRTIEVPIDERRRISIAELLEETNNDIEETFDVDEDWRKRIREPMIRIFMKRGWGMSDETYVMWLFAEDAGTKASMLIGYRKMYNDIITQVSKQFIEAKQQSQAPPPPPQGGQAAPSDNGQQQEAAAETSEATEKEEENEEEPREPGETEEEGETEGAE